MHTRTPTNINTNLQIHLCRESGSVDTPDRSRFPFQCELYALHVQPQRQLRNTGTHIGYGQPLLPARILQRLLVPQRGLRRRAQALQLHMQDFVKIQALHANPGTNKTIQALHANPGTNKTRHNRPQTVVLGKKDGRVVKETKHFVSLPPHLLVIIDYI